MMKFWRLVTMAAIAVLVVPSIGFAASDTWQDVPLPKDVRLVAPKSDVPKEITVFSGKWVGWWGDKELPGIMVVEEIHGNIAPEAIVVYAWGIYRPWRITEAGWVRVRGTFSDGLLHLSLPNGALVTYGIKLDGTLDGAYDFYGRLTRGMFRRVTEGQ